MIYIFNTHDKFIQSYTEYTENLYKRVINGEWSFNFETPINPLFIKGNKIGFYDRENKFRLFVIDSVEEDFEEGTAIVSCLNDYTTLDFTFIEDKRVIEGTCTQAMTKLLEESDYTVGEIEIEDSQNINFYFSSRLEGLNEILNLFGGELDIRIEFKGNAITKKIIDIKQKLGTDTGLRCTYDTNLTSLKRTQLEEKFFNRLYGFGESLETEGGGFSRKLTFEDEVWIKPIFPIDKPHGQKYIEDLDSIAKWGIRTGKVEVKTKETSILIQETYKKLLQVKDPKIGYVTTVKDIRNIEGFEHYDYSFGDTINIIEETKDITITSRIIEESYSIDLTEEINIILGTPFKSLSDDEEYDIREEVENIVGDMDLTVEVDDTNFPNSVPNAPTGEAIGYLDTIGVKWIIENKTYYDYEVYASTSKGFTPNFANRVFKGKASYYIHKCRPKETWYFKVRGVNTAHNVASGFSEEITGSTAKVADGTVYFENGAIGDALIGTLRADRAWIGKIQAQYINLLEIKVGDESNPTFHIDSFARLYANFTELRIESNAVATEIHVNDKVASAKTELNKTIKNVNDSVINIKDTIIPSMEDNLLTEDEKGIIESNLKPLQTAFREVAKEYNSIYVITDLTGSYKTNLKNAYDAYKLKYDGLINTINSLLNLTTITESNKIAFNNAYDSYNFQVEIYRQRANEAVDSISEKRKELSITTSNTYTNSEIKKVNDKINLKVGQSEVTTTVNNAVNNIQVAGKNLLIDSKLNTKSSEYLLARAYFGDDKLVNDEIVTITIKGKLSTSKKSFGIYNSGGTYSVANLGHEDEVKEGYYQKSAPWRGASETDNSRVDIYTLLSSQTGESTVEWIKIERGNKSSLDWSPNPYDTVNNLKLGGTNLIPFARDFSKNWVINGESYIGNGKDDDFKMLGVRRTNWVDGEPRHQASIMIKEQFNKDTEFTLSGWYYIKSDVAIQQDHSNNICIREYDLNSNSIKDFCSITLDTSKKEQWVRFEVKGKTSFNTCRELQFLASLVVNGHYFIYKPKLEIANKASEFSDNPNDSYAEMKTVKNRTSEIELDLDKVSTRVESNETKINSKSKVGAIRYIRDWLKGNSVNSGNHYCELKVFRNNVNIAQGKTPTTNAKEGRNLQNYTDDNISHSPYAETINDGNWYYLQVDLGEVFKDIDLIQVWHYWADKRSYNHKLEVSHDGIHWIELFNSEIGGAYAETENGRTYIINQGNTEKRLKYAEEKITDSAIINTVMNSKTDGYDTFVKGTKFEQTMDDFRFTVENSGHNNILENPWFLAETHKWDYIRYDKGDTAVQCIGGRDIRKNNNWNVQGVEVMEIWNGNGSNRHMHGIRQTVPIEELQPYTISLYAAGHRTKHVTIEYKARMENGSLNHFGGRSFDGISESKEYGATIDDFTFIKDTFFVPSGARELEVFIWSDENIGAGTSYLWVIKPQLEKGTLAGVRKQNPNEVLSNTIIMNGEGIEIEHDSGSKSKFTHEAIDFFSPNGYKTLRVKDGGFNFHTWHRNQEMVGFIKSSYQGDTNWNGVTLSTYGNGDYVSMGVSTDMDENGWWTTPFITCVPHNNLPGFEQGRGIHLANAPVFVRSALHVENGMYVKSTGSVPHCITTSNNGGILLIGGDNEVNLGIRYAETFKYGIKLVENDGQANKTYIDSYGDWNFQNYNMWNMRVAKTLAAQSMALRSRTKDINDSYAIMGMTDGEIRYTCRETEHITNKTLIVELPQIMAENIEIDYHVNISKLSWGDYRIIEKTPYYFEIETNVDDFSFTYEIVAKQIEKPHAYASIARDQFRYESIPEDKKEESIVMCASDPKETKEYWELYKR